MVQSRAPLYPLQDEPCPEVGGAEHGAGAATCLKMASQSRWCSNRGSTGKPICSNTWHSSLGNRRGMDSARVRFLRWTLS